MSDPLNCLLIDMGNSRIKYAFAKSKQNIGKIYTCDNTGTLTESIQSSGQVLLSSVGDVSGVSDIKAMCVKYAKTLNIIQTQAENFGINCAYENFYTLGVDRWLAILAARNITSLPVAVIDLGTANTCDIVVKHKHLGGWISPGFSLMRDSLLSQTQKVFTDQNLPQHLDMGETTPDCVAFGCLAAQSGFVTKADQYLADRYENYIVLLTGGGQKLLSIENHHHIQWHENLVLKGLARFI